MHFSSLHISVNKCYNALHHEQWYSDSLDNSHNCPSNHYLVSKMEYCSTVLLPAQTIRENLALYIKLRKTVNSLLKCTGQFRPHLFHSKQHQTPLQASQDISYLIPYHSHHIRKTLCSNTIYM